MWHFRISICHQHQTFRVLANEHGKKFQFPFFYHSFPHIHTDNVDDDVEKNLRKEREVILGSLGILEKLHTETIEQIRKLRASIYLLDRDLENKETSLQIDQQNLVLRENQLDMKIYEGKNILDPL